SRGGQGVNDDIGAAAGLAGEKARLLEQGEGAVQRGLGQLGGCMSSESVTARPARTSTSSTPKALSVEEVSLAISAVSTGSDSTRPAIRPSVPINRTQQAP